MSKWSTAQELFIVCSDNYIEDVEQFIKQLTLNIN